MKNPLKKLNRAELCFSQFPIVEAVFFIIYIAFLNSNLSPGIRAPRIDMGF